MKTLIERLQTTEQLTDTEQELAGYVLNHLSEIPSLSAKELSKRAFVSKASVSRLCQKLGAEGYRDFQVTIARETEQQKLKPVSVDVNFPFSQGDSEEIVAAKMAELMQDAIRESRLHVDTDQIRSVAELLHQARRIYYYAEGDTLITLTGFMNRLIKLGIFSVDIGNMREMNAILETVGVGDVLVQISYSGTHILSNQIIGKLRLNGTSTVLMTAKDEVKGYDLVLSLPAGESSSKEKIATYYSQTSIEYILNLIYAFMYHDRHSG